MKLLRVTRFKVICSKGRIEKGDTVVLPDDEYKKIIVMNPDAFEVISDDYPEPTAEVQAAPKAKRGRARKVTS